MSIVGSNATEEVDALFASDDLPSHWQLLPLKQVTKPSSAKVDPSQHSDAPYLSLEHIEANTTKIVGQGQGKEVRSTKAAFRAGDVLYGKLRPYLNKVTIPDFNGIASTDILVFPPNDKLDQRYLMRFLNSATVVEYAHHHSMGLQMPRIGFDVLGEIEIPLPPIAEQKAIADLIDSLADRVNSARDRLAAIPILLKRFRQSVLAVACSGQLTADWRAEHGIETPPDLTSLARAKGQKALEQPVDIELPELPASYASVTVGEVVSLIQYGTSSKSGDSTEGSIPVLRMGNIQDGELDLRDLKYAKLDKEILGLILEPGNVLFNRTNSPDLVGKTTVFREPTEMTFASYLIRLRALPRVAVPEFLSYWINSSWGREWAQLAKTDGVSQSNINGTKLSVMPIPLPHFVEQVEIVRRVQCLFGLVDAIDSRLAEATKRVEKTTQAILAKAFRGELVLSGAAQTISCSSGRAEMRDEP